MKETIFNYLLSVKEEKGAGYIVLIDPDKNSEKSLEEKISKINECGVDAIFVGGVSAGAITANYDGSKKSKTKIEDGAFVGSDVMLVAPITVGEGAYIGAGSVITKDVPADALAIERSDQKNIEGYSSKKRKKGKK